MAQKIKKPETVGDYIAAAPREARAKLRLMRLTVRAAAPRAREGLKWGMPAFSEKRVLLAFAAFKHHIGFYPTPSAISTFRTELANYKTAKGSIQFPLSEPLPTALIKKITAFRVRESREIDAKWKGVTRFRLSTSTKSRRRA